MKILAIALATAVLLLTGCSSNPGEQPQAGKSTRQAKPELPDVDATNGQVDAQHFKGTVSDYARKFVACLRNEGWDVEVAVEGDGYTSNIPASQGDAFNRSRDKCRNKLGDAPSRGKVSHAEMVRYYEFVKGTVACLRAHGWPTTDPPSLDTWIQQNFFTHGVVNEPLWAAYDLVAKDPTLTSPVKWREINQTCPQSPA